MRLVPRDRAPLARAARKLSSPPKYCFCVGFLCLSLKTQDGTTTKHDHIAASVYFTPSHPPPSPHRHHCHHSRATTPVAAAAKSTTVAPANSFTTQSTPEHVIRNASFFLGHGW